MYYQETYLNLYVLSRDLSGDIFIFKESLQWSYLHRLAYHNTIQYAQFYTPHTAFTSFSHLTFNRLLIHTQIALQTQ